MSSCRILPHQSMTHLRGRQVRKLRSRVPLGGWPAGQHADLGSGLVSISTGHRQLASLILHCHASEDRRYGTVIVGLVTFIWFPKCH